ncbi:hypothetical protein BXY85_1565 [Roseivirga pacifica]|uniref:Peptidase E n=1 Tax=Roseivirga pacifica TaxID=1267423 RepID=A0A1I0MN33_9BACT|nr:DUF6702 family protein [Roseivirga pacifica]RKQ50549.1 hypothetical protein BXY85_1565 [Roseivirga pacifica]SEV89817.1 hypothetical protein SAMN05216290_0549 [Roseivirga pacifica]
MPLKLLYSVILTAFLGVHPFHVSVTDIEHNPDTQSLQISQRIFIDDLEQGLKKHYNMEYVDTYNPTDAAKLDSLIGEYLKSKVFILLEGKQVEFTFLGSEVESDARWCYYEVEGVSAIKEAEVTNVTLMEVFEDQQNIIHFKSGKKQRSYKLDRDTKHYTFNFTK